MVRRKLCALCDEKVSEPYYHNCKIYCSVLCKDRAIVLETRSMTNEERIFLLKQWRIQNIIRTENADEIMRIKISDGWKQ